MEGHSYRPQGPGTCRHKQIAVPHSGPCGGSLAESTTQTPRARPESGVGGRPGAAYAVWLGQQGRGTSPFQPPLHIVVANNGANKESLFLT